MGRIKRQVRRWLGWRPLLALAAVAGCSTPLEDVAQDPVDVGDATGLVSEAVYAESDWSTVDNAALPESAHPYVNNLNQAYDVVIPVCAQATRIKFSRVQLGSGDSLSIYDGTGHRVQRMTAPRQNAWSNVVTGNTARIVLRSNQSGTGFGFAVSALQIVTGPMPCPRPAWVACAEDEVAVAQEPALCTCPRPPACVPLADFTASYGVGGGFAGSYDAWMLRGNGEIVHMHQVTHTSPLSATVVGHASHARLKDAAQEIHASTFFLHPPAPVSANMTRSFQATQGALDASTSWPSTAAAPEMLTYAIQNLEKAIQCGAEEGDARCLAGFACVDGRCTAAPGCVCSALYDPQCGVNGNTYSNGCALGCSGEAFLHAGECGQQGDTCGGYAQRTCVSGQECSYPTSDGTRRTTANYSGEEGVCARMQVACRCANVGDPVCGSDGQTYPNPCSLGCQGVGLQHEGACGIQGDRCAQDGQCQAGLTCQAGQCAPAPCTCTEQFQPVCGNNSVTFGNACMAACAQVPVAHDGACGANGDACGGIRGLSCAEGTRCRYEGGASEPPHPDAMGLCRPDSWCDTPSDCGHTVRLSCGPTWYCEQNACRYECPAPVDTWTREAASFSSAHPYANNTRKGWTATGDATTRAVRFVFSSFATEAQYDTAILSDENWVEVTRYSGNLGAFTTVEVPGRVAHLVFTSDASITRQGFVGVAVEYKH